jgi:hypothetical protein
MTTTEEEKTTNSRMGERKNVEKAIRMLCNEKWRKKTVQMKKSMVAFSLVSCSNSWLRVFCRNKTKKKLMDAIYLQWREKHLFLQNRRQKRKKASSCILVITYLIASFFFVVPFLGRHRVCGREAVLFFFNSIPCVQNVSSLSFCRALRFFYVVSLIV